MAKKGIFWNEKEVNKENLLEMIAEAMDEDWNNSDIEREYELAMEKLYHGGYEGHHEDLDFIVEKLKDIYDPNLQDVAAILREGGKDGWYYQANSSTDLAQD